MGTVKSQTCEDGCDEDDGYQDLGKNLTETCWGPVRQVVWTMRAIWTMGAIKNGRREHPLSHTLGPGGDKSGRDLLVDYYDGI